MANNHDTKCGENNECSHCLLHSSDLTSISCSQNHCLCIECLKRNKKIDVNKIVCPIYECGVKSGPGAASSPQGKCKDLDQKNIEKTKLKIKQKVEEWEALMKTVRCDAHKLMMELEDRRTEMSLRMESSSMSRSDGCFENEKLLDCSFSKLSSLLPHEDQNVVGKIVIMNVQSTEINTSKDVDIDCDSTTTPEVFEPAKVKLGRQFLARYDSDQKSRMFNMVQMANTGLEVVKNGDEYSFQGPVEVIHEAVKYLNNHCQIEFETDTVTSCTPNNVQTADALPKIFTEKLSIEEPFWQYVLFTNWSELEKLKKKNGCNIQPKYDFEAEYVNFVLEVTTSSSNGRVQTFCEDFSKLYQKVVRDVSVEFLELPGEILQSSAVRELESDGVLLSRITTFHIVGPEERMDEAKRVVRKGTKQFRFHEQPVSVQNENVELFSFTMPSGLRVHVSQGNLIHQKTDAIVNPANVRLHHGCGAARVIADAAGPQLVNECNKYIATHGMLIAGEVIHTTAGYLSPQISHVLHVAGPDAREDKDPNMCEDRLKHAFVNCLLYASVELKCASIALPAISAGIFRVPIKVVARAAWNAVDEFEKSQGSGSLKDVHFVNLDIETVEEMSHTFQSVFDKANNGSSNGQSGATAQPMLSNNPTSSALKRPTPPREELKNATEAKQRASSKKGGASGILPVDEDMWQYMIFKEFKEFERIKGKYGCEIKERSVLTKDGREFYVEISSSSKKEKVEECYREFSRWFYCVVKNVITQVVDLPDGISREIIKCQLREQNMLLSEHNSFYMICNEAKMKNANDKLWNALKDCVEVTMSEDKHNVAMGERAMQWISSAKNKVLSTMSKTVSWRGSKESTGSSSGSSHTNGSFSEDRSKQKRKESSMWHEPQSAVEEKASSSSVDPTPTNTEQESLHNAARRTSRLVCLSLTEQDKLIGIEQGLVNREGGATCISLPFMPSAGNNIVPERRSESNVHINEYPKLTKSKADDKSLVSPATDVFATGPAESPAATPANVKEELCVICMDTITNPKELLCKHRFCTECIDNCFAQCQPKCPSCGQMFGAMKGNQPNGTMTHRALPYSLAGHLGCGHIEISYTFPSGIQESHNPSPGQSYSGTQRVAYLPDNTEGREVLELLKQAFEARVVFTIGKSITTGRDNTVVWNDIHHKTSFVGPYGYPDPTYLARIKAEIGAKGIVPKNSAATSS